MSPSCPHRAMTRQNDGPGRSEECHNSGIEIVPSIDRTDWIEPIWKMLWSNKALLAVLWEMNPGHPNLLPASFEPPRDGSYIRKPLLAREGANITVVKDGRVIAETGGDYGEEGFIYQALYD